MATTIIPNLLAATSSQDGLALGTLFEVGNDAYRWVCMANSIAVAAKSGDVFYDRYSASGLNYVTNDISVAPNVNFVRGVMNDDMTTLPNSGGGTNPYFWLRTRGKNLISKTSGSEFSNGEVCIGHATSDGQAQVVAVGTAPTNRKVAIVLANAATGTSVASAMICVD